MRYSYRNAGSHSYTCTLCIEATVLFTPDSCLVPASVVDTSSIWAGCARKQLGALSLDSLHASQRSYSSAYSCRATISQHRRQIALCNAQIHCSFEALVASIGLQF
jgi:hypothetical protein